MSVGIEGAPEAVTAEPRFESTLALRSTGIKHFDRDRFIDALNKAIERQLAMAAMALLGKYVKPGEYDENLQRYGSRRFLIECFGRNGNAEEHLPKPYTTHDTIATIAREAWQDSSLDEESFLPQELEGPLADELIDGHQAVEVRIVLSVAPEEEASRS